MKMTSNIVLFFHVVTKLQKFHLYNGITGDNEQVNVQWQILLRCIWQYQFILQNEDSKLRSICEKGKVKYTIKLYRKTVRVKVTFCLIVPKVLSYTQAITKRRKFFVNCAFSCSQFIVINLVNNIMKASTTFLSLQLCVIILDNNIHVST